MHPVWHGVIGIGLIASFFLIVAVIAYQLYGPGIDFEVPDYLLPAGWATTTESAAPEPLASYAGTLFECEAERALKAEFLDNKVHLALSDGRRLTLPQAVSGGGTRYANTDESFVFWNEGHIAFVEESGTVTYANCRMEP